MFIIWKRRISGITIGNWFRIWETEDGADAAAYLKQIAQMQGENTVEMTYKPS